MKTLIFWLIKKFLTPKKIATLLAGIIADLLRKASKSENWDLYKAVVRHTEYACHLFDQCYEDDEMDKDDEERIAKAIEMVNDIHDIIDRLEKLVK